MTGRKVMSDDLLIRLNDLADARHDDLDVAAEAAVRIIDQARRIAELEITLRELAAERGKTKAALDAAVKLVLDAGVSTGHAETPLDLIMEVLRDLSETRAERDRLLKRLAPQERFDGGTVDQIDLMSFEATLRTEERDEARAERDALRGEVERLKQQRDYFQTCYEDLMQRHQAALQETDHGD